VNLVAAVELPAVELLAVELPAAELPADAGTPLRHGSCTSVHC
jgi:hypothetical protein